MVLIVEVLSITRDKGGVRISYARKNSPYDYSLFQLGPESAGTFFVGQELTIEIKANDRV